MANHVGGRNNGAFFETDGPQVHLYHNQALGNPVKFGDGCATVTDYKLPFASQARDYSHWFRQSKPGRRERGHVRSQDIGLVVLVMARKVGQASRLSCSPASFSVKEKDEASLPNRFRQDSIEAFILRFVGGEGFLVFRPRARPRSRLPAQMSCEEENEEEDEDEFISALVSKL